MLKTKKRINNRPSLSARDFPVGYESMGRDNKSWIVGSRTNGSHFWKRNVNQPTKPKTRKRRTIKNPKTKTQPRKRFLDSIRNVNGNNLDGLHIILIGQLWADYEDLEELITRLGGYVSTTIAKKRGYCTWLVLGKTNKNHTALKRQANDKNIEIVTEDELLSILTETLQ
ncbi:hypothetical protein CL622_01955 [archaeon]|nr:hypothetical protein [archaeon]|tara:strand:+ start:266 stop:775 length:510 start_codon:yes stop_codon:yes gene_type:complete